MNTWNKKADFAEYALAIEVWEDDGGAPAARIIDHGYGRRIEADRSWTVYHVFSGVPARIDGVTMGGLSRADATGKMLLLNRRSILQRQKEKQKRHTSLRSPSMLAGTASQPWR